MICFFTLLLAITLTSFIQCKDGLNLELRVTTQKTSKRCIDDGTRTSSKAYIINVDFRELLGSNSLDVYGVSKTGLYRKIGSFERDHSRETKLQFYDFLPLSGSLLGNTHRSDTMRLELNTSSEFNFFVLKVNESSEVFLKYPIAEPNYNRHIAVMKKSSTPSVKLIQHLDAVHTRSLTFISSGYKEIEEQLFNEDVNFAVNVLRTKTIGMWSAYDSKPWGRYFPLINIYSVFEASVDSGASRRSGPHYDCNNTLMRNCGPAFVDNNLDCAFGTPQPSRLGCSIEKAKALASHAPANDVIIVLVNDQDYGGSASDKFLVVTNGAENFAFLLLHQLAHAVGGVGDEYSYGRRLESNIAMPNCANTKRNVPWEYFIKTHQVAAPVIGCTFSNYYRPTQSQCIMHSNTHSSLCPVCTAAIATELVTSGPGISMAAPRCPYENFITYIAENEIAVFTINRYFVLDNTDVEVTWVLPDGSLVKEGYFITVIGKHLHNGRNILKAIINDKTDYIRNDSHRSAHFSQTIIYEIYKKEAKDFCHTINCTDSSGNTYVYCGRCSDGTDSCLRRGNTVIYDAKERRNMMDSSKKSITASAVVMSLVAFCGLFAVFAYFIVKNRTKPQPVYVTDTYTKGFWFSAIVLTVVAIGLSIAAVVCVSMYFPQAYKFNAYLFVFFLIVAVLLFIVLFIGLTSILSHSSFWSTLSILFYVILAAVLFSISVVFLFGSVNRSKHVVVNKVEKWWKRAASKSRPKAICYLQWHLECSGFYYSCSPTNTSFCTRGCQEGNRNPNACLPALQRFMHDYVEPLSIVGIIVAYVAVIAAILMTVACLRNSRARRSGVFRRMCRRNPVSNVSPLTSTEITKLAEEFKKIDKSNCGYLEGEKLYQFVREVFPDDVVMLEEADMLISGGPMTFEEFLKVYFPYFNTKEPDPRLLTPQEVEKGIRCGDLKYRQFRKYESFTKAAQCLSPSMIEDIFNQYVSELPQGRPKDVLISVSMNVPSVPRSTARFSNQDVASRASSRGLVEPSFREALGNLNNMECKELLKRLSVSSRDYWNTHDGSLMFGITAYDFEGLRCAWSILHPVLRGTLSDRELEVFYEWSHEGSKISSEEHFKQWKSDLDIRGNGVGWAEFCYPYAQKSLLIAARNTLAANNHKKADLEERLSKEQVCENFGETVSSNTFLPYEKSIPSERVLVISLGLQPPKPQPYSYLTKATCCVSQSSGSPRSKDINSPCAVRTTSPLPETRAWTPYTHNIQKTPKKNALSEPRGRLRYDRINNNNSNIEENTPVESSTRYVGGFQQTTGYGVADPSDGETPHPSTVTTVMEQQQDVAHISSWNRTSPKVSDTRF